MSNSDFKPLTAYFDLMAHHGATFTFQIAKAFGLLDCFQDGKKTVEQVAEACQIQKKGAEHLLNCLAAMHILEKESDGKHFSPAPALMFFTGTYANAGSEYWEHLPEFLKSGEPLTKMDDPAQSEKEYQRQVSSLEWMLKPSAMYAASLLAKKHGAQACSVLDLGAGSGIWSFQFLLQSPKSKTTLADWNSVLDVARGSSEKLGLQSRVEYLPGNYHETTFPKETYDIAILGNITHIETEERLLHLLKKTHAALKPGGEVIIFDVLPSEEKGALPSALYALGLSLRTKDGYVYKTEELNSMLTKAGFKSPEFAAIPTPPYTMGQVSARRT